MSRISLEKDKIKVLFLEGIHDSAVQVLNNAGYTNIENSKVALSEADLIRKAQGAHLLGIRSRTQLTENVLSQCPKLIAIGCFCIGTNQIDLVAAQNRGICVFNAPYSNTRSVAELVISEAILLLRRIPEKNKACHTGGWPKSATGSYEIRGKTLGIIGYGAIGSQVSVMAESLGMKVVFYDAVTKLPLGNATQVHSMQELLAMSHIVSLHVPETPDTQNMLRKKELSWMQEGSILLNASRGNVVDIDALAESIRSGYLGGAAIDVFPVEPKSSKDEFISPLRELDNVILTPHVGGSTQEAQENIGLEVAEKLIKYSDNGTTTTSVNFPEVALPKPTDFHRLLHIHQNVPGMIAAVNQVFSENNINVSGQYLQTNEKLGYVVLDVDSAYSNLALEKLRSIEGTIRCRVLY
ncbi:MAG: phosphoglycerate dehydrogenase [Planctomycetota bacterium]|nr:phosphoglycerate dehydrogenase [Planctomycetota bacterium]